MSDVYSLYYNVGEHMTFSKYIYPTILSSINRGLYSCQFFMGNPKTYTRQKIFDDDILSTKKILERFPINLFTHFPYISNLNGSVDNLAWNGNEMQDTKTRIVIKELQYELSIVSNFYSSSTNSGVVIHPGCYPDINVGLDTIAKSINLIEFSENSKLILENSAGEGRKLCKNLTELSQVINGVDTSKKDNIGICLDTAHMHGSGIYDLRKCDDIDRMFYDFQSIIGINKFHLLHLNDSSVPFGSKKDRHACLGDGYIWSESFVSLIYLLNKCKENNIPMILESPDSLQDILTLSRIQPN